MKRVLVVIALSLLACRTEAADPMDRITAAIEEGRREINIPGLAVVAIRGDKIVYQQSFGERDRAKKLPVTPQTAFYIASVSKSFTALTAKLLQLEGKLDLDAPLDVTLPELKLPAPMRPDLLSLRDLMTHRLGFDNEAFNHRTSYSGEVADEALFHALATTSTPKKRVFDYDNIGYILAGYAMKRATGSDWQSLVTARVLEPVGMKNTSLKTSTMQGRDVATPYIMVDGVMTPVPLKSDRTMHAAGGTVASAEDLARWLRVNMSDGMLDGKRLFPAEAMREVHAPQVNLDRKFAGLRRFAYGLGWYRATYGSDVVVHHFGGYAGAQAHVSYMPEHDLGVVVLANSGNSYPHLVALLLYDTLLGRENLDTFRENALKLKKGRATLPQVLEKEEADLLQAATGDKTRPIASYAGVYTNDAWGTIDMRVEDGRLMARMGDLRAPLKHLRGETFFVRWFADGDAETIVFDEKGLTYSKAAFARR